jgi:hypothetical protein
MGNMNVSGGASNFTVNGVNTGVKNIRELQEGVTLEQIQQAIDGDGYDSMVFEQDGKAYIAYGDNMNFSGLEKLGPGDKINANLNGRTVNLVLFENEVNSASEGVGQAWDYAKKVGTGAGKYAANNGLEIVGAGMTLGMFARLGGAKTASTAGQSIGSKLGTWAFGPAKELTGQAAKGFGKAAKWGAIVVGGAAVLGTAGMAMYGASRGQDDKGIKSITK